MIMRGNQLSPEVQADALRRFVQRFTKEHVPHWARGRRTSRTVCSIWSSTI